MGYMNWGVYVEIRESLLNEIARGNIDPPIRRALRRELYPLLGEGLWDGLHDPLTNDLFATLRGDE